MQLPGGDNNCLKRYESVNGTHRYLVTAAVVLAAIGVAAATNTATSASTTGQTCAAHPNGTLCVTKVMHAEFSPATVQDQDTNYSAVAAAGTDDGFVAGSSCSPKCAGVFARTTDGGAQWRVGSTGAVLGTTLEFPSASDGFLLGNLASSPACGTGGLLHPCHVLLSTADAGRHWSVVGRDLPPIWSMTFVSPLVGFVGEVS